MQGSSEMRALILAALLLSACSTVPAVHTQCVPVKAYSADQEKALAAAVVALPPGSALIEAMADYGAMRAAARACAG